MNEYLTSATIFTVSFILIFIISVVSYRSGVKDHRLEKINNSEFIATSVLGMLALFLGFSFSMAVSRYENRRQAAVNEANAISTAYLRSTLIKNNNTYEIRQLYLEYLISRIDFYNGRINLERTKESKIFQDEIWRRHQEVTRTERGALESAYTFALTEMFDAANTRNFALLKTLPLPIYGTLLFMGIVSFGILMYDRGFRGENSRGKFIIFITLFSLLLTIIYDLDHSTSGMIRIGQDALYDLKESIAKIK